MWKRRELRDVLEHLSYRDENILGAKSGFSVDRGVASMWTEESFSVDRIGSGRIWSDRVSLLLGHVVSSCAGQFLTITHMIV